uniref:Uncharacterized protein n=1 Tax=Panagrolaimus superbus TaxID=310955 RepID=A0A914Y9N2_9BILA
MDRLRKNYFVILCHLEQIFDAEEFRRDRDTKLLAKGHHKELATLETYLYTLFILDVLEPLKILSNKLQTHLYSITQLQDDLNGAVESLEKMEEDYGHHINQFLRFAECEDAVGDECKSLILEGKEGNVFIKMETFFENSQPKQKHIFTRRRKRLNFDELKNIIIPKLIHHLKTSFPEDKEFVEHISSLNPSNLPTGVSMLSEYSKKIEKIAPRFGGNSARIVNEFIDIMRYLISNDYQTYMANIYLSTPDF